MMFRPHIAKIGGQHWMCGQMNYDFSMTYGYGATPNAAYNDFLRKLKEKYGVADQPANRDHTSSSPPAGL